MMENKDYYGILGIDRNASEKDIKAKYRKLSVKYHPDKQVGKSDEEKKAAEEKFKEINEAYSVLSDPKKKKNYDIYGSADGMPESSFDPFDGMGGFSSFMGGFADMFTHANARRSGEYRRETVPGRDIKMEVPLTLEEIYSGCTKKLKYNRSVRCPNCHGKGGFKESVCPDCNGTGHIRNIYNFGGGRTVTDIPCPRCHGTGRLMEDRCPTCNGSGYKSEENIVTIKFGAGTPQGYAYVVKDGGNESHDPEGKNGDFYAFPTYNIDLSRYTIQGMDVIEQIYLPYYELLLGMEYIHTLPDKTTIKIQIPSCIPECDVLRINGKGMRTLNGTRGDYYLQIHYQIPVKITDDERKKIEELRDISKKSKH